MVIKLIDSKGNLFRTYQHSEGTLVLAEMKLKKNSNLIIDYVLYIIEDVQETTDEVIFQIAEVS